MRRALKADRLAPLQPVVDEVVGAAHGHFLLNGDRRDRWADIQGAGGQKLAHRDLGVLKHRDYYAAFARRCAEPVGLNQSKVEPLLSLVLK